MDWGSPIFVLAIVAMALVAKVMSTAIRARHGYTGWPERRRSRCADDRGAELLAAENEKLKGMIVRLEDRLSTLERIATDQPSRLSAEIERLR